MFQSRYCRPGKNHNLMLVTMLVMLQLLVMGLVFISVATAAVPIISDVYPASVAHNYDGQIPVTVTAENANFFLGQSRVEILDSNDQVTNKAGSVTASSSTSQLTFILNTGLAAGQYKIRVTTGSEVVTSGAILTVRGTPGISLSTSRVTKGYDSTAITINGTNTGFSNATTVSVLDSNNVSTGKAGTSTVSSGTSLSFTLAKGLEAGDYTVKVATGSEVATASFKVLAATVVLKSQGNTFSTLGAGYSSAKTISVTGTNTSFAQGTTTVTLFNPGENDITGSYISGVTVNSSTSASFTLGTGLDTTGTYKVRITTGEEIADATFQLVSPEMTAFSISSGVASGSTLPRGYADTTVSVTASNSAFSSSTTVKVVDQANKTTGLTVIDTAQMTFTLKRGLTAGTYTVQIDVDGSESTASDRMSQSITITAPSIVSISPNSVLNTSSVATTITVVGSNTHFSVGTPVVDITGINSETISTVTVVDDHTLTFKLTPSSISNTGSYGIQVTTSSSALAETVSGNDLLMVSTSGIRDLSSGTVYTDELGIKSITVVGHGTSFRSGTTRVMVDHNVAGKFNVTSPISLSFIVPKNLNFGSHTLSIDQDGDGNADYFTTFLVTKRSISLSPGNATYSHTGDLTVTGRGVIFDANNKPVVRIIQNGQAVALIGGQGISVQGADRIILHFPGNLTPGTYTLQVSWTDGTFNGLSLATDFTLDPDVSGLYFMKDGKVVESVTVNINIPFNLVLMGNLVPSLGGGSENKTSTATWKVISDPDSIAVVDAGWVTITGSGTAIIKATYLGISALVEITGKATGSPVNPAPGGVSPGNAGGEYDGTGNKSGFDPSVIQEAEKKISGAGTFSPGGNQVTIGGGKLTVAVGINGLAEKLVAAAAKAREMTNKLSAEGVALTRNLERKALIKLPAEDSILEVEAKLPVGTMDMVRANDIDKLEVQTPLADFGLTTKTFGNAARGKEITLSAKRVLHDDIPVAATRTVPEGSTVVYLHASVDGKKVTRFEEPIEISLPYVLKIGEDPEAITVFVLKEDGLVSPVGGRYNFASGKVTVSLEHFSIYFAKESLKEFEDLGNFTWAERAIQVLAGKGIVNGRSQSVFDPKANITRAEFAALLIRMLKLQGEIALLPFKDVPQGAWYAAAVAAAYENGIVSGRSAEQFDPNGKITRQEMAVMISRVLIKSGYRSADLSQIDIFKDQNSIGNWAKAGVSLAIREGIVTGMTDGTFAPKENANRAQASVMLYRLFKK